jgi:hypothetical protein
MQYALQVVTNVMIIAIPDVQLGLDVCHCGVLGASIIATPKAQLTYITVKFHWCHYYLSRELHFDRGPRTKESADI